MNRYLNVLMILIVAYIGALGFRYRTSQEVNDHREVSHRQAAPTRKTQLEINLQKDFSHFQQMQNLYEEAWFQVQGQKAYNKPQSIFKILVREWPKFSLDRRHRQQKMARLVYVPKASHGACVEPLTLIYRKDPKTKKYFQGQLFRYDCKTKKHITLAYWNRNDLTTDYVFYAEAWHRLTDMGILNSLSLMPRCLVTDEAHDGDTMEKMHCTHVGQKTRRQNQHIYSIDFEHLIFEKSKSRMLRAVGYQYETMDKIEKINLLVPLSGSIKVRIVRLKPEDGDQASWTPLAVGAAVDPQVSVTVAPPSAPVTKGAPGLLMPTEPLVELPQVDVAEPRSSSAEEVMGEGGEKSEYIKAQKESENPEETQGEVPEGEVQGEAQDSHGKEEGAPAPEKGSKKKSDVKHPLDSTQEISPGAGEGEEETPSNLLSTDPQDLPAPQENADVEQLAASEEAANEPAESENHSEKGGDPSTTESQKASSEQRPQADEPHQESSTSQSGDVGFEMHDLSTQR